MRPVLRIPSPVTLQLLPAIRSARIAAIVLGGVLLWPLAAATQEIRELLPIAGIDYVGPLPAEVQRVTIFSAGVAAGSTQRDAARALIDFLVSPRVTPAISKNGLERP